MSATPEFEVESCSRLESGAGFFAWLRLADGAGALWVLDLTQPPGRMQRLAVVEGA